MNDFRDFFAIRVGHRTREEVNGSMESGTHGKYFLSSDNSIEKIKIETN